MNGELPQMVEIEVPTKMLRIANHCLDITKRNPTLPQFKGTDEIIQYAIQCFLSKYSAS